MKRFLIRDIEALTGIKAHTLRVWEQRYNILTPKRTDTNIRFYDDEDVRLLLNVTMLNDRGYKISEIAKMSADERCEAVNSFSEDCKNYGCQIQYLANAMVKLDEAGFEKILSTNILQMGFEDTVICIIFPFLAKTGMMWQTGAINSAHEHFVSHIIRQKLLVAIDGQSTPADNTGKKFLLFLPGGETHELGLLFANYLIKSRGHHVLYLGANMPCCELANVAKFYQPDYIFTVLTTVQNNGNTTSFVDGLCCEAKEIPLLVTGCQVVGKDIQLPKNAILIENSDALIAFLTQGVLQEAFV